MIWERAGQEAYAIVSKDNDFRQLSFVHGAPPKVIWLSVGNAGTEAILFGRDGESVVILLGGSTKQRQQPAIKAAKERWADYRRRKAKR